MKKIVITQFLKSTDFECILIDKINSMGLNTEFYFAPNEILYNYIDHNFWNNVVNCILSNLFDCPVKGAGGTFIDIELKILNKRIIEPSDKLINAEQIFNSRNPYAYGTVNILEMINDDKNEFKKLDVIFTFSNNGLDLGNIRYQIYSLG